ncbi:MAG: ROK family protein [Opitutales bacterium]|nr:ROK family protein [Opitutales bacterium]
MKKIIGVDMGGTKINSAVIVDDKVEKFHHCKIDRNAPEEAVVKMLSDAIAEVFDPSVEGIGIGVPTLVDIEKGIVYDVQNIPAWRKVYLKDILETEFDVPVYINNDANCFVMGEKVFGAGKGFKNLVGLTIGTGLGAGLILNDRLAAGANCGAGEFSSIPYRDDILETYASGKFFKMRSGEEGFVIKRAAIEGDERAKSLFREFGDHLGHAIISILFSVDPEAIILGGSISKDYELFEESMWKRIHTFTYRRSVDRLKVFPSKLDDSPVLGAAALCLHQ